jgi:hypothetical protein
MASFDGELENEAKRHHTLATLNYQTAYLLSVAATLASFLAGLSVAGQWFGNDKLAILSATPGAILIVLSKFKFEERSNWHYRRVYAAKRLLNKLRFQGETDAEVSTEWGKVVETMEAQWPGLGKGKG